MKKRIAVYSVIYYLLVPALFYPAFLLASAITEGIRNDHGRGALVYTSVIFLFVLIPVLQAVFVRFSPLKFYVDPFAAAEIPLLLFLVLLTGQCGTTGGSVREAFRILNNDLADDHGMGYLLLAGLFLLGVVFSVSIKRKHGESIAYRIINKQPRTAEEKTE